MKTTTVKVKASWLRKLGKTESEARLYEKDSERNKKGQRRGAVSCGRKGGGGL